MTRYLRDTRLGTKMGLSVLAVAAAVALTLTAAPSEAKGGGPKASYVKGTVEVGAKEEGPWKKLKKNRRVPVGHFVKTGAGARAELKFSDGSVIRIGEDSVLAVNEAAFSGKSKEVQVKATLVGGKAWSKVSKLAGENARFEVQSDNAVAGVRGTIFRLNVDSEDATVVKVYTGSVAVSNSPFFAKKDSKGEDSAGPIDFKNRKEVAKPFEEVSKKEWEQIVGKMMQVKVAANGAMEKAGTFTAEADVAEDKEWVAWNQGLDEGKDPSILDY
jgi:hypothetical protein